MLRSCTLSINVQYDDAITDPDAIAEAADKLLETALSTDGILDECGAPEFGLFDVTYMERTL